jgi:membrane associated rhomboid family serine protease
MAFRNYGNSFQKSSPVVLNLIIINALAFVIKLMFDGDNMQVTSLMALWPYASGSFKPYQLVSHMFAHGTFGHVLFNMFALWSFGSLLERVWGPKKFLTFYLACGLAAAVAHLFLTNNAAIGASGAVMGLLGAYAYLFPNTELLIFPLPFPVKAKWAIIGIAAIDVFGGVYPTGSQIAHFAHLGGMAMGLILVIIWNKGNKKTFY